jgi:hypothetical protein
MYSTKIYILIVMVGLMTSCRSWYRYDYITSKDPDSIIIGMNEVKSSDIDYIPIILNNAYDCRETSVVSYKGQSVYQSKMNAMQRISGISPDKKIDYRVDSSIVRFYTHWAIEKGYLKK